MGTLLNRRRYMGGGGALPYDAEVEYLESRNGAYIDSGLKANSEYTVTCRFCLINANTNLSPCGYWAYEVAAYRVYWRSASNYFYYQYKTNSARGTNNNSKNSWHDVFFGNLKFVIDNVEYSGTNYDFVDENIPFIIFGAYSTNTGGVEMKTTSSAFIRIASISIVLNGEKLRDLIPVRKDGVGYMYDKVSGHLFGNSGTGNFILGNDIT